ncbi:MAG: glycosyltransferase family 4 protein [Candidatus Paceibacterota bacterium]|jgi:glycosyltransferase involved in cell wall biosynthesis
MNDKNKKILFVITKSNFGGAQRYVLDLATTLSKKGYDIAVASGGKGVLVRKLLEQGIRSLDITGMGRDVSLFGDLRAALSLWHIIEKERPDVIHLNSSKAGIGALVARLCGVKNIVFTLHGIALNEDRPSWQKFIIKQIYFLTILLSHKTIAVSDALRKQTIDLFPQFEKKIILIHNGILAPEFLPREEALHALSKETIPANAIIFGTIGELHPIKGHQYLIEGFKEALDKSSFPLFLFIIGEGEERKKRQKQIEDLKLSENVFLCGRIDNAVRVLKAFDVFVFSSLSEGLPYAVVEAGFASLPVIATEVGGTPEIITNLETGILVNSRSSTVLAEKMLGLAADPSLRKQLGDALSKKMVSDFSIEKMTVSTEKIYNS